MLSVLTQKMEIIPLVLILSLFSLCRSEKYKAWYLPEDKLENYPNHPNFTSNEDIWMGFTLKKRIFSEKEWKNEVIGQKNLFLHLRDEMHTCSFWVNSPAAPESTWTTMTALPVVGIMFQYSGLGQSTLLPFCTTTHQCTANAGFLYT